MSTNQQYEAYVSHMRKLADVEFAIGVLSWDKEVNLPTKGAQFRAQQVATLSGIAHEIFTDQKLGHVLQQLQENGASLNNRQAQNIALTFKDYSRAQKLDKAFVIRRSEIESKGYHAWLAARKANDFSLFKDALADLVAIKREQADKLGYEEHPYDALLDEFEPGAKASALDVLFKEVKAQMVDFVRKIRQKPNVEDHFLQRLYPEKQQWDFGLYILKAIGYDFEAGRQDLSPHPFTINFNPNDVRVTTRIDEHNFGSMTWSCIHEGGHALYEQGLQPEDYGLPTGKAVSLGIHESQSRLWENNVGRSLIFWQSHYPKVQASFPEQLKDVSIEQFFKGINKIQPSLVRVESDELHYHFHILIRYEIEKGLIEGSMQVEDLEEIWKEKYKAYLDLDIPDSNQGVLQDIHWAYGSIGYFPTYSLGSFYAAQFFAQAQKDIPNLLAEIEAGSTTNLLNWLRTNIHQHGRMYTADDLCKKITGEPLNFKYFMDYAKEKFSSIYGALD